MQILLVAVLAFCATYFTTMAVLKFTLHWRLSEILRKQYGLSVITSWRLARRVHDDDYVAHPLPMIAMLKYRSFVDQGRRIS